MPLDTFLPGSSPKDLLARKDWKVVFQEGDRVVLLKDANKTLTKGAAGTVVSYQLQGNYEVRFDKGEAIVVSKKHLARE